MGWKDIEPAPLSVSQMTMYQRCPKQYEYRYMRGLKRAPGISMVTGISVHASAEVNYDYKLKTKKQVKLSVAMDAFDTSFNKEKQGADIDEPIGQAKDRGYAMAKAHYEEIAPQFQPIEKPEFEFKVPMPGVKRKLYGFIDLIAAPILKTRLGMLASKRRLVRDNKTSGKKKQKLETETSTQLTGYAYVHKQLFGQLPDGVGLDVMIAKRGEDSVSVQRTDSTRTEAELTQFVETARQIEKGIISGVFPPVNNPFVCNWCGYKDLCLPQASRRAAMVKW